MDLEKALLVSAIQGITIAVGFASLVLLIATKNIILTFFAIICVTIVIVSVVAIIVLQGWQLGVAESISIVIVIGLSVDYVVHLASDYHHSVHPNRNLKMQ